MTEQWLVQLPTQRALERACSVLGIPSPRDQKVSGFGCQFEFNAMALAEAFVQIDDQTVEDPTEIIVS